MSLKDFFNIAKNDPYNKALDKWRSLKSIKLSENQDKYISVSLEVIELCKSGIIKSPGWGDQYILLANAYYSLATAFPDIYGYKYLLLAKETIDKWKTDKEFIKDDNWINGFKMLNLINNQIENHTDEQMVSTVSSELDLSTSGKSTMKLYCEKVIEILTRYKTSFDNIQTIHPNLQINPDVFQDPDLKSNFGMMLDFLLMTSEGKIYSFNPDEKYIPPNPPGSFGIAQGLMNIENRTKSLVVKYTRFLDTPNLGLLNSATPIIEEIPKMLDQTFSEIKKVMKQIE